MGLIKAAIGAVGGTLSDAWKEAIHCGAMDNTVILRNGTRMHADSKRSSNKKLSPNVITTGSVIMVEENTCMLTIDNGKVTNVVTEAGEYIFDSSSAPSVFTGGLGGAVDEIIKRFMFGGAASTEQRVVYINMQPLPGIPFGTSTPVPYPDPRYNTTIDLRFYGTFEIEIENAEMALRFYQEVAGKGTASGDMLVTDIFKSSQYKNEFLQAMLEALNQLSNFGISYNQISSNLSMLTENVRKATENNWQQRGFVVKNIGMGSVTISDESKELLKDRLKADTMLGSDVQKAMMAGSVARGIENAASNSAGAAIGFMNMNTATNVGSGLLGQMQGDAPKAEPNANGWRCTCGAENTGKFCANCGKAKPEDASWTCSCGANNKGKFCAECGAKKPEGGNLKCDKCGYQPKESDGAMKFCPECGDPFTEADKI